MLLISNVKEKDFAKKSLKKNILTEKEINFKPTKKNMVP